MVFGTDTSKSCAPSEMSKTKKGILGFNATQQHAKNAGTVIQCEECSMWRLIFSKTKLSPQGKSDLAKLLEDILYTCGASFDEISLPDSLKSIIVSSHIIAMTILKSCTIPLALSLSASIVGLSVVMMIFCIILNALIARSLKF